MFYFASTIICTGSAFVVEIEQRHPSQTQWCQTVSAYRAGRRIPLALKRETNLRPRAIGKLRAQGQRYVSVFF